jgi:membrane associated rhomboid family serine protease
MFFFLPIGMNYRTERLPLVTFSLIGLNTLIYLVSLFFYFRTDGDSDLWILHHFWLIPAKSYIWTYLTSMFVHAGFLHLFGNMLFLFLFGSCVEDMIGRLRFAVFYLVAGVVAEMFFIATDPQHFYSRIPMGGASGAITGCMAMYLMLRADIDIEFGYFIWLFVFVRAGKFEMPAWMAIVFWFLRDLIYTVIGLNNHSAHDGVAHGDHVGGFLAGLGLMAIYKFLAKPREEAAKGPDLFFDLAPAVAAARRSQEMPSTETPTIYLHDGNEQSGPFTLSQIQVKLQRGEVGREASYWSEGMNNWESVVDLAGPIG